MTVSTVTTASAREADALTMTPNKRALLERLRTWTMQSISHVNVMTACLAGMQKKLSTQNIVAHRSDLLRPF